MSNDVIHGYPDSYYAATRNLELTFPELASDINADVCVVGGGLIYVNRQLPHC
jgi:hypothetical protein